MRHINWSFKRAIFMLSIATASKVIPDFDHIEKKKKTNMVYIFCSERWKNKNKILVKTSKNEQNKKMPSIMTPNIIYIVPVM